jgi:carboxypeptidase family protein
MSRLYLIILFVSSAVVAWGQTQTATMSGKVTDQTGALIPGATVTATGADGTQVSATSDQGGGFSLNSLPAGSYTVSATAKGFAQYSQPGVTLTPGHTFTLNMTLQVQAQEEKVNVQSERPTQLDVSSSSSAGALVIKGKDLEALSDDPDELSSELQALAGPSAGPSGGQIYIDGFTGGQLPPKSAIREIRVNQNPFSAQYDKLGYGRIEIFTKPGADKFHGQFFFNDNNSVLNSKNPYVPVKPSYNSEIFDGNLGGPINKKASFFLDASRRNMNEFSALNAVDPSQLPNPLPTNVPPHTNACSVIPCIVESVANPRTRSSFSPRVDVQLTSNNTFTARYQLTHDGEQNSGLGTFSLPSVAYNLNETEHTLQLSDTQIFGPTIVNETRFQFQREINHQLPLGTGPTINVQQSFTYGQNTEGLLRSTQDNYELQNYTSITAGKHLIKFGGRLRRIAQNEMTNANFNGEFVFSSTDPTNSLSALQVYQNALQGKCPSSQSSPQQPDLADCPSQFMLTMGSPNVSVGWFDVGLYAEDEYRVKPNLSVTYGLRFESQNQIHDHADFAPRIGIAWGLGGDGKSAPKTVLRGGFGIFYDRFGYNLVQQATLLNGVTQQKAVMENPQFFSTNPANWPSFSQLLSQGSPTIYQVSPTLTSPYTIQAAGSIERQITKAATVSVTYLNSRGLHAFYIDNINAPYNPLLPTTTRAQLQTYAQDNVYQYQSGGIFKQNQLILNARVNTGKILSLFGFYTLSYANSNVASGGAAGGFFASGGTSAASFVSDQFDPMADYGRAAFDVRHRAFIGGNVSMPYGFSLFPFVIINSGAPYNITTGQDNNGDSVFNDRPWLTSANKGFDCRSRNDFSTTATGSPLVPINSCTGPGNMTLNLRLSKTFGFGRETKGGGGPGGFGGRGGPRGGGLGPRGLSGGGGNPFAFGSTTNRRYNLTFSISARNLLNTFNPGNPVANLSSPLFGETLSTGGGPFASASANRRVDLQVRFSF